MKKRGKKNAVSEQHADVMRRRVGKTRFGKKSKPATDAQMVQHYDEMTRRFGEGVLEPAERRLRQELTGQRIERPMTYREVARAR